MDKIRAESCYQVARSYHVKGEYDQAFQYYFQSVSLWPEYPLAQYRLGQMYIFKKEPEKALGCFENVLSACPDNYETLKVFLLCLFFRLN